MSAASDFAASIRALASALRAAATDPADGLRLLDRLAAVPGEGPTATLARRAAVIELCRASAAYRPRSYEGAAKLRARLCELLDAEIVAAGDAGQDEAFAALRRLRAAVVRDLTARGASLARLTTVRRRRSLPALVLAHQLYSDAARQGELVRRTDPPHPLFMPPEFVALDR